MDPNHSEERVLKVIIFTWEVRENTLNEVCLIAFPTNIQILLDNFNLQFCKQIRVAIINNNKIVATSKEFAGGTGK